MPNIYGKKSWSEMQKEDKKRRQTNPTPQEVARASKVQYTGEISGESAKKGAKSYQWEQDLLGDYKGRSYNDKYAKFAKQQGFSFTDSVEFRKFMDVQENSKKPIKTNKDGSVRANQSFQPGQGMQTLDSLYNSIISDSNKKFNANLASRQKEQQKQADLQRAKQHDVVKATNTERSGPLGFLDRTLGRSSDAMINDVMSLFDKNFVKKQNENYAQIAADKLKSDNADTRKKGIEQAQMLNAQTRPAKNASEKAADFIGTGLGEAAPYMFGAYGAADKALKGVKEFQTAKPLIQDLVRGGVAGLGVGATKAGIQNLTDKNYTAKDAIDRILMEALTAGGGDAVLGAVGRNLNLKGQLDTLLKDTKSATYTDDLMQEMVNAGNKTIGNPVNVLADAKTITPGLTDAERQSLKDGILPKVNTNTTDTILNDLTKPTNNVFDSLLQQPKTRTEIDNILSSLKGIEPTPKISEPITTPPVEPTPNTGTPEPISLPKTWDEAVNRLEASRKTWKESGSPFDESVYKKQTEAIRKNYDEQGNLIQNTSSTDTPETSSTMQPMGIVAGKKIDNGSWVGEPPTLKDKITSGKTSLKTGTQTAKTHLSSETQPIKDVEREIATADAGENLDLLSKGNVNYKDSLVKGLRRVNLAVNQATKASEKDYGTVIKDLRKAKISRVDFDEYVSAVHFNDILTNNRELAVKAGDVHTRLQEIQDLVQNTNDKEVLKTLGEEEKTLLKELKDLEAYDLPKEATPEKVQSVLARWENTPAMKQAQQKFIEAQQKDLKLLVDSGLYSQADVDKMIEAHPNYVSMSRMKEDVNLTKGGGNTTRPNKFIKQRGTGSEEKIHSPLDSAIRNRMMTYTNVRRNLAMKNIEKLAGANGGEKYFKKLNSFTASDNQMQNSVKFFKDGKPEYYEVPPSLKSAFDSLDARSAENIVTNALRSVNNVIKKGSTYFNTDFIFASPFRETNSLITSRTGLHPGELILGYMDSFMGKNLEKISGGKFKSYRSVYEDMGGHSSGFVDIEPTSLKQFTKAMDKGSLGKAWEIVNPLEWINKVGAAIEHGPKLSEFRSAVSKGYDFDNAMYEAVDMFDYTDMGKSIKPINKVVPYLNPAIRGNVRYFQAAKENFPKWLGKNLLYVTTPTVGIYAMRFLPTTSDEQRSRLRNMPEYKKNLFWHIPVPNSDKILAIPKMHTGAQLFANPIERILDHVTKEDPTSIQHFIQDTSKDGLNVLVPPTAIAGISQLMSANSNYDPFLDMPIEDIGMTGKAPEDRYNMYTSEASKKLAKAMPDMLPDKMRSPARIDYVLKGLTGGSGRDVLDTVDNVVAKTGSRPAKIDTTLDILNPVRRYENKSTDSSGVYTRLKQQKEKDEWGGKKSSPSISYYKKMKEINKEIGKVRESKELTSKEKQAQVTALRNKQRALGDEAIKQGVVK